jgi:hypothetical protein
MIYEFGPGILYGAAKIDKRKLTNVQRAAMGLPLRGLAGNPGKREQAVNPIVKMFDTSPEVRLAEQLRDIFCKWGERGIGPRFTKIQHHRES